MASKAVMRPLASVSAAIGLKHAGKRGFGNVSATQAQPLVRSEQGRARVQIPRSRVQEAFRRSYAEVSVETQRKVKRNSWRFLRWTWRLTLVSAVGGLGWMAYGIYQNRTPADQADPDPSKKTLVVLGMHQPIAR